jgi:hypothetical protein
MKQEPVVEQLLPLPADRLKADSRASAANWDYIYEPDARSVLEQLLMRYLEQIIYQSVAENIASEQSARMVAMKAASDNATSVIDDLTLVYNKTRRRPSPRNCRKSWAALRPSRERKERMSANPVAEGKIVQCIGAVIDIQFPRERMPRVYDALTLVEEKDSFAEKGLTFEVEQQLGDGVVRTIALGSSDGLAPRDEGPEHGRADLGARRPGTLGRVMDVLGRPIDERGPVKTGRAPLDPRRGTQVRRALAFGRAPRDRHQGRSTSSARSPRAARSASSAAPASARP